jgi:hypothetical protein
MGYTRTNERNTDTSISGSPNWPEIHTYYYSRTRTIKSWEIRGLSETYATHYCDTHANDTNRSFTMRRNGDGPAFTVEVTKDSVSQWSLDSYTTEP